MRRRRLVKMGGGLFWVEEGVVDSGKCIENIAKCKIIQPAKPPKMEACTQILISTETLPLEPGLSASWITLK